MESFGETLIGWYLPSGTARAPEEEPSTNSIGGGRRLLKASTSLAGRNERGSSWVDEDTFGEKGAEGRSGDASIIMVAGRLCAQTREGRERERRKGGRKDRALDLVMGEGYVESVEI